MKVLVTGGLGFIGSHTLVQLLKAGWDVVVIDNLSNSNISVSSRVKELSQTEFVFIEGDIRNKDLLDNIFKKHNFDAVIHFAGLKSVSESILMPLGYYQNNVSGLIELLKAMKENDVKSLIFSSSATVYGNQSILPITEIMPVQKPTNPYGISKLMCENVLESLYNSDKSWNIICLRYFNPVGADPSGLIGEDPDGIPNNLMPMISQTAIGMHQNIKIYGDDYPTPDGTGIRDYIHVNDLSKGHLSALEAISNLSGFEIFNLGTGKGFSVKEVISEFEDQSGKKVNYIISSRRSGDVACSYACIKKAKEILKWEATLGLHEMCRDSWNWQISNHKNRL